MSYSQKEVIIQKVNTILQIKQPNLWKLGVRCIDILIENRLTGGKIQKRIHTTLQKGCRILKIMKDSLSRENTCNYDNFELCNNPDCNECKLERFDIKAFADKNKNERGGIWNTKINGSVLQVKKNSSKQYEFTCINCKHPFLLSPGKITSEGRQCPLCSSGAKQLCGDIECKICKEKSIMTRPNIMECWSKEHNKHPATIKPYSNIEINLKCPYCKDLFTRNIRTIGESVKLKCDKPECAKLHDLYIENLLIEQINCIVCNKLFTRTNLSMKECLDCCKERKESMPLCGNEECIGENCRSCYEKSFAKRYEDENIEDEWDEIKNGSMLDVPKKSKKPYTFICILCKIPYIIPLIKNNIKCPSCCSKKITEEHARKLFHDITGKYFITTHSLPWLKDPETSHNLELDGYNAELSMAFEYQGKQHYECTYLNQYNSLKLENIKRKDKLKLKLCAENNVDLIVIPYTIDIQNMESFIRTKIEEIRNTAINITVDL